MWRHVAPTCPDTLCEPCYVVHDSLRGKRLTFGYDWMMILGCYPFFDGDPFLVTHSPGIYAIGNQPAFASDLVVSPVPFPLPLSSTGSTDEDGEDMDEDGTTEQAREPAAKTRVVLVPRFSKNGEVVLVHSETLAVKTLRFGLSGESWR